MNKFRVCVVGVGNISKLHIATLTQSEYTELVAVCDIDKQKADKTAEKYGVKAFYDFDEMLKWGNFDALHICTPHYLHASMAVKAMNNGKHIFTEKPMAMKYEDAVFMNDTARKNNVYLGVCFQNRYNDTSVRIKEILDSGELGKIKAEKGIVTWDRRMDYYNADNWHGTLAYEGGGVIINQSIHTLDLLQWFAGAEIFDIKASISQKRFKGLTEVEDTADAVITFDNGVNALFYASICYTGNSPVYIEIICEKGKIILNDDLFIFRDGKDIEHFISKKTEGSKNYWGGSHSVIIEDFYRSIIDNKPFAVDGESGIVACKMFSDMYKSAGRKDI